MPDDAASPFEIVAPEPLPDAIYRRLFEASFGLAIVADEAGRIRALSDAAALFAGHESIGASLADAIWWRDAERVAEGLGRAREGLFERFYTPVQGPGGHLTFLIDVQSIEGPGGADWLLLEARDVTTLVSVEHQLTDVLGQLERERNRLRALLDALPDRVLALDAAGRATVANEAMARSRQMPLADLEGMAYLPVARRPDLWERALAGETVHSRLAPEDSPFGVWVEVTLAPIWAGDVVEGAVALARDATAKVESEQLRRAIGTGRVAMLALANDGRVEVPSDTLADLFRAGSAASLDALLAAVHPDDADWARMRFEEAFGDPGTAVDLRLRLRIEGGAVWVRGRSLDGEDGSRFVGVAYEADPFGDPAASARWADLHEQGGWAGRREGDRVDVQADPDPDPDAVADRVAALRRTGLLDSPPSPAFDVLTRAATEALGVPVSLVSLVDGDRQFFKSIAGLTGPAADARETPLSHSFCQHVANERRPLVVRDARETQRLAANGAVDDLGVIAYLGVPIAAPDGHVIGALCAIDSQPHAWTEDEVRLLSSLAEAVTAEVAQHQSSPDL